MQFASATDYIEEADDYDIIYDDAGRYKTPSTRRTTSAEIMETSKIELSDVYFAPRLEDEAAPTPTDHPNKTYCKKDYWWRPYVEKLDPPPPHILALEAKFHRSVQRYDND